MARQPQGPVGIEPEADVADLLADLPDRERTVMVLRYVDDLTVAKIAERLGVGERAVESLVRRALTRLRRPQPEVDHA